MKKYWYAVVPGLVLMLSAMSLAGSKEAEGKHVDEGSFGVFMGGRRVGTETFTITQNGSGSVIQSEFKANNGDEKAVQTSTMTLTGSGEIKRYEWKELSPGKAQSVIVPNDQVLVQRWTAQPNEKPQEQPYLLPASTSILDDYFFVHREILAWKFLATTCHQDKGQLQCPLKQRAQFGSMNPRQHNSAPVSMEFQGREKVSVKGADQELLKVVLKSDVGNWEIWLDDQFRVLRILIPSEGTEVIRD